jgi:hypothetical protein
MTTWILTYQMIFVFWSFRGMVSARKLHPLRSHFACKKHHYLSDLHERDRYLPCIQNNAFYWEEASLVYALQEQYIVEQLYVSRFAS